MVTHSVYFQHRKNSKVSMLIKARRLLLMKNCHAKGRELTPRTYSQLQWVDRRSQKISTVCSMLLWQNRSTFCRFTGSAALRHCARLVVSKKFVEEKIFAGTNFCELVFDCENHENFCLTIISWYTVTVVEVCGTWCIKTNTRTLFSVDCFLLMLEVINYYICLLWSCFLRNFSIDMMPQDPSILQ